VNHPHKYAYRKDYYCRQTWFESHAKTALPLRTTGALQCHFLKSLSAVVSTGLLYMSSFSFILFYPWSDIFGTTKGLWQVLWDFCLSNNYSPIKWSENVGQCLCVCDYETWNWTLDLQTGKAQLLKVINKTICLADILIILNLCVSGNKQQQLHHCTNGSGHQWEKQQQHNIIQKSSNTESIWDITLNHIQN